MKRILFAGLALLALAPFSARADAADAKGEAQKILDAGAALFDTRDARAMAETYAEDAVFVLVVKDQGTGEYKTEERRGRSEMEAFYRKLCDDASNAGRTTSKNTVEFARLLADDLMVIHGEFQPNTQESNAYPFIQVREKQGGKWLMKSLRLFVVGQK